MPFAPTTRRSTSVAVVFGACISFWLGLCGAAAGQDTAGLWVTQPSLTSRTAIERLVDDASRAGFTILNRRTEKEVATLSTPLRGAAPIIATDGARVQVCHQLTTQTITKM